MPRHLALGASACAAVLAALAAAASPARAQVLPPDLVIEGPIDGISEDGKAIHVMGIRIRVDSGTFDTPTRLGVPLADMTRPLPGRASGFLHGTAIVTGGSNGRDVYATNVFSDVNENVIVGEVTRKDPLEVNGLPVVQLPQKPATGTSDFPIPSSQPRNIFGFDISPNTIDEGTLVSIEGYLGTDGKLYWHTLEADAGRPLNLKAEVSILRAQCRRNGNGKDELEVRGAVHPASGRTLTSPVPNVEIYLQGATSPILRATPVIVAPAPATIAGFYAEYTARSNKLTLGRCPQAITVKWGGDTDAQVATVAP